MVGAAGGVRVFVHRLVAAGRSVMAWLWAALGVMAALAVAWLVAGAIAWAVDRASEP